MGERISNSNITLAELLKEAATKVIPPEQEEGELTYREVHEITGRGLRSCKYYLEKYFHSGLLNRRKVIAKYDGSIQFAYFPRRGKSIENWQEFIENIEE